MGITVLDVSKVWQSKLDQKQNVLNRAAGRLVSVNGSVTPPTRPNYVYFLEFNQDENAPPSVVFNDAVNPVGDLPVIVGFDPGLPFRRKVLQVYTGELQNGTVQNPGHFNVPPHAQTHQYVAEDNIGIDPVLTFQPAIQPLKVTAGATALSIDVQALIFHQGDRRYLYPGVQNLDISTYIPGTANFALYLYIYLDPTSNTLSFFAGTAVDTTFATPPLPDFVDPSIPGAYLYLANGVTSIANTDITDARFLLNTYDTTVSFTPRRVGDILMSLDGVTFEPVEILVDQHGDVITDNNGVFVVI